MYIHHWPVVQINFWHWSSGTETSKYFTLCTRLVLYKKLKCIILTNKCLKPCPLPSSSLLLNRHNFKYFIFQGRSNKEINDVKLLKEQNKLLIKLLTILLFFYGISNLSCNHFKNSQSYVAWTATPTLMIFLWAKT